MLCNVENFVGICIKNNRINIRVPFGSYQDYLSSGKKPNVWLKAIVTRQNHVLAFIPDEGSILYANVAFVVLFFIVILQSFQLLITCRQFWVFFYYLIDALYLTL